MHFPILYTSRICLTNIMRYINIRGQKVMQKYTVRLHYTGNYITCFVSVMAKNKTNRTKNNAQAFVFILNIHTQSAQPKSTESISKQHFNNKHRYHEHERRFLSDDYFKVTRQPWLRLCLFANLLLWHKQKHLYACTIRDHTHNNHCPCVVHLNEIASIHVIHETHDTTIQRIHIVHKTNQHT